MKTNKKMQVDLNGKVTVITGGGGVLGRAMALEFAQNGAKVVISDRVLSSLDATSAEIRKAAKECIAVQADITDKEQTAKLMDTAVKQYGGLDILVNNAGVNGGPEERKNFWEYSDDLWEKIIGIDLGGVYYCSKPAARYMIEHGGGCIINIASVTGIVPLRLQCAYAAAKAGVVNLSKAMALELAEKGVRVNVIAPGSVMTPQLQEVFYDNRERREALLSHIPQHRPGDPGDIAAMACFLASGDADYLTGSVHVVDGGWICGYSRDFLNK